MTSLSEEDNCERIAVRLMLERLAELGSRMNQIAAAVRRSEYCEIPEAELEPA